MFENIQKLALNEIMDLQEILKKLTVAPDNIRMEGLKVDILRRQKTALLQSYSDAKMALSMAEANAGMQLPAEATNDLKRKAFITQKTSAEQMMVGRAENALANKDGDIAEASRELQYQQDIMTSCQKRADVVSSIMKYLSPL